MQLWKRSAFRAIAIGVVTLFLVVGIGLSNPVCATQTTPAAKVTEAIQAAHFPEPLVATAPTTPTEDEALLQALAGYNQRATPEDVSAITSFLSVHPHSGWATALLTNLGLSYLHYGYFSRALDVWQKAWGEGKDATDPRGKALVDRAVSELARLYASFGRNDELAALFDDIGERPIAGSATEAVQSAREELVQSRKDTRHLFICGPLALQFLMMAKGAKLEQVSFLQWYRAGPNGTNLAEVARLADQANFAYRLVFRKADQPVPVPAVVHWKVGHFAAITGEANGRFQINDPVFPHRDFWIPRAALDAEASGYFMVPAGSVKAGGWREATSAEASNIWGKGPTGGTPPGIAGPQDPQANPPAPDGGPPQDCPLCSYNIGESTISVSLADAPVGYSPPIGPSAKVRISYNQREDSQPANFSFFNVSPKWTLNWLSYVTDDPTNPGASVSRYIAGGGAYFYSGYQSGTGQFTAQNNDGSILVLASQTPITYRRQIGDGSIEVYSQSDGSTSYPRNIFLSQIIDPRGNTLTLNYDGQERLTSLTDATGRQTTFTYGLVGHPLLVTQITDPFGRSAVLTYDSNQRLNSITDVIGLTSSFSYDANSLVNSLTTPYGTTTFAYTSPGASSLPRFVQVTDPLGNNEREEWLEPAPIPESDPAATVPVGMPLSPTNAFLTWRDSFHWDKSAYVLAGCTPSGGCDYTKARIRHFAHVSTNINQKSTTIESVKYPLENRIWFNYPGQTVSEFSGSFVKPVATGRVLDDGTTQLTKTSYDTGGYFKVTQMIDPLGRTTSFAYSNHVDLASVSQTTAYGVQQTIAQFIYNTRHRPIFFTDAAGQTSTYSYNSAGQPTSITNPLGQKTSYQYNATGDLTAVINANNATAASFTYDAYDRIRTYTDSEGWTATYDYDAADRVTKITYPDGTARLYTYDRLDLASFEDRQLRQWTYAHDANRRLTSISDPLGKQTLFGYRPSSELTSLTDPKGNVTSWSYDVEGRLTQKTYPDISKLTYTYENTTSRLKSVLDALGQTKQYSYAQDNQLAGISYLGAVNATPNISFAYDPYFPRRVSMVDGNGTTSYSYVPVGSFGALQLQQESGPLSSDTITYTYDEVGRGASRTVAGAGVETFGFDPIGRLTSHASDLGSFTLTYLGETNQITQRQLASSTLSTAWSYLPNAGDRRLAEISNVGLSSGQYSTYGYATTPENFISAISETSDSSTVYPSALTQTTSYNNLNQLTNLSGQALSFDANGNLLSDGQRGYSWDAENRLVGISYPGQSGKQTAFTYDGLSRRTAITSTPAGGSATLTSHVWCGRSICQARNASNSPTRGYYVEGEFVPGTPAQSYYYGLDQIGSVRRTFASTSSAPAYGYDPYGNALQGTAPLTDFSYAGMFYNADSGLYLTQFRAYDPVAGRWLSRDPIGEAIRSEVNLYTYVRNDPIGAVDPRGLWQVTMGGGWGYGAAVTFGVNGGQTSFGAYFGFGYGFSADYDPNDLGRHTCGLDAGVKGSLDVGPFGISSNVNLQGDNSANVTVPSPDVPYMTFNILDPSSAGNPTFSFGGGGYVGAGGTYYFR
jgi:RHS repeat-associated protein